MLGVLEMDVETCITEYKKMAKQIYATGSAVWRFLPESAKGFKKHHYAPEPFVAAIKNLVKKSGLDENASMRSRLPYSDTTPKCKV